MSDSNHLTAMQLIVVLISTMIGVGIILMPRDLARSVDSPNLWMSILLGAIVACIISTIYVILAKRYPGCSFYEMAPLITGKWIGFLFNLYFVVYCLIIAAYILRITAGIIKSYLLDTTPISLVVGSFLIVTMYLISNGGGDVVRFFQLYFPIMMFMFFVLCVLSIKDVEIQNLRPILREDFMNVFLGIKVTFFSFLGIEFILIFASLIKRTRMKRLLWPLWTGIWITTVIYMVFHIISIGVLGVEELKEITFPTIEMAKSIEFQGFFFERFELIFLFGWLTTAFTSFTAYTYAMTLGMKQMFRSSKWFIVVAGILIFILTTFPKGLTEVFHYSTFIQIISSIAIILLPFVLLVISLIRRHSYVS